jgi:hypothetical protein
MLAGERVSASVQTQRHTGSLKRARMGRMRAIGTVDDADEVLGALLALRAPS